MTDTEQRLSMICRVVDLLRRELSANGNVYSGAMTPNLQSITDLADPQVTPDNTLARWELSVTQLERLV